MATGVGRFVVFAVDRFGQQYVIGLAQQIAYNFLFSLAPLMIFLTACVSLLARYLNRDLANPIQPILDWTSENVPPSVATIIDEPIREAMTTNASILASFGGVLALWSARNAIASAMRGLNATYGIREVRPFIAHNVVAILLTLGLVVGVVAISLLQFLGTQVGEEIARVLGLREAWSRLIEDLSWPATLAVLVMMMVVLHRFGPTFRGPMLWYLPGAVFTVLGIVVATSAFGTYFRYYDSYSAYGAFGAVLVLMLWLYIISLVILLGGVINASLFATCPPAQQALQRYRETHPAARAPLHAGQLIHDVKRKGNGLPVKG